VFIADLGSNLIPALTALDVDHMLDWGMLNDGAGIFQVAVDQLCLLQLEVNQCSAKVLPDFSLCGLVWSIMDHLAY
jgi:hypothetical protein